MKLNNRIGKYEVGRTLGEGNFGKVKYAIDVNTRKSYAIKMLDKDKVFHHNIVDHIKREICSLKFIKHPNVVRLYEVLATKKKIYIVLEYISGGELLDKISYNGKLEESQARLYFQQLIDGVGYCHSRGVYHRDLKPENILLDAKGNVKICDFGLSALPQQLRVFFQRFFYIRGVILMRGGYLIILCVSVVFQADGLLHTTCGSPNYVAPEVIAGRGYDGASADVWSCGVILFLLLTGRLPFDDNNLAVLYNKILKSEFQCPKWLSPSTCNLIRRILDPNPKTRISIPGIMEDEWFKQGYSPAKFVDEENTDLDDVDASYTNSEDHLLGQERGTTMMNAFQLIAMSSSLDLSGFFEEEEAEERKTLFTSTYSAKEIMRKIEETVTAMGFVVQKKNDKLNLLHMDSKSKRSGYLSVATEVFQVTPCLHVVEMRKSTGDIDLYRELCSKLSSDLSLQESDREWEGKQGISAHCLTRLYN